MRSTICALVALACSAFAAPLKQCLCVFDVDRTLTGKQGWGSPTCPTNKHLANVSDDAYLRGDLTLSSLAQGLHTTFCSECYLGIVSAGDVSGPGSSERSIITGIL